MILAVGVGLVLGVVVALLAGLVGQALREEVRTALHRWLVDPLPEAARSWPAVVSDILTDLFRPWRFWPFFYALLGNLLIAGLSAVPARHPIADQPAIDPFFTLAVHQRAIVLVISAFLIVLLFSTVLVKTRVLMTHLGRASQVRALGVIVLDGALTCGLFALGLSLAPQIYYGYYLLIFPSLPVQWVVQPLIGLSELWALFALAPGLSLADLLAGLVLRTCLLTSGWLLVFAIGSRLWFGLPGRSSEDGFPVVVGLLATLFFWVIVVLTSAL